MKMARHLVLSSLTAALAVGMTACTTPASDNSSPSVAPLVSATSHGGVTVLVLALGHLNDPANTFYEMFTSPSPGEPFVLSTPSGTTTNGGIVVSTPSGSAAIRQFDLLKSSAVVALDKGHETGAAQMTSALAPGPSSVASNPVSGSVALLTTADSVIEAPSASGAFRTVATLDQMKAAAPRCAPTSMTAISYSTTGELGVGLRCSSAGAMGLVIRTHAGFSAVRASASGSGQFVRLDPGPDGAFDGLISLTGGVEMVRVVTLAGGAPSVRFGERSSVLGTLESTSYSDANGGCYALTSSHGAGTTFDGAVVTMASTARAASATGRRGVLISPQSDGGLLEVWITDGGTVHLRTNGTEQVLKVAVPYGSAH